MPLRDHFRPPLDDETSWEGLHAQWPAWIVSRLNKILPSRYVAAPRVRLGASFEIDVAAVEKDKSASYAAATSPEGARGAVAAVCWSPPEPTLDLATDLPEQDEYEVRVYDTRRHRRLVAAIELVSPANKDRPETRLAFATKCAALLREGISVGIVDIVTTRQFNLYADVLELLGQAGAASGATVPFLYAVASRWQHAGNAGRLRIWDYPLTVGEPLPTLPLLLDDDLTIPVELEQSYEQTCDDLRIP